MDAANLKLLKTGAQGFNVSLGMAELDRFERYLRLLEHWNSRINLTAAIQPNEVVAKHFLDSLAIIPYLEGATTLVDIGSGAGFPGAVVALVNPKIRVTLVESVQKKAAFLEALRRELGLDFEVRACRMEHLIGERFDVAVSRAVFSPSNWLLRGAGLVAPEGRLFAMLGRERTELVPPVGFGPQTLIPYEIPFDGKRALAMLRKLPAT